MEFFDRTITVFQTLVVALGVGLGILGVINLLEGYGDNRGIIADCVNELQPFIDEEMELCTVNIDVMISVEDHLI